MEAEYDLADRPCRSTLKDTNGNIVYRSTLCYDKLSNPVQLREDVNGTHVTDFTYDRDNRVTRAQFASNANCRVDNTYDALGRLSNRTATNGVIYSTIYSYAGGGYGTNSTTPMVSAITQSSMNFSYAYDSRGNIVSETRNGSTTTYAYDGIGQLVRVNDPHENATWVYNYDRGGNITSKVKYAYTTGNLGAAVQTIPYTYDGTWKDKLVSYNGNSITYDAIGNPLSDGTWTYTWEKGRQLKQLSKSGTTVQFKYDHNGIRTQKAVTINGTTTTTNYIYSGKKLVHLTQGSNWLHFYYDGQSPAMVNYNGTLYTYIKNLQGNIVGILSNAGSLVVEYKYDAWGRPLSTTGSMAGTLGLLNPFRYRGYVFDEETQYIWLVTRYYNPIMQRFINADTDIGSIGCILMHNILTYSINNPIMRVDTNGKTARWFTNATENEVLSGAFSALPWETRVKHIGTGANGALIKIYTHHDCIEQAAEELGIEPELIEAVLFRELICVGIDDTAGELGYRIFGRECSTGIGQIKPRTAIKAEIAVYGSCDKTVSQMYNLLQDDCTNIRYVAMNTNAIMIKNDITIDSADRTKYYSPKFLLFARYNSTSVNDRSKTYAGAVIRYYEAFKSIRKVY